MKREPWVSLEEVAEHLGVSKDTVVGRVRPRNWKSRADRLCQVFQMSRQ